MQIEISIRTPIFSTESKEKITACFQNLIGYIPQIEENKDLNPNLIYSKGLEIKSLEPFFNHIRHAEIVDAVRYCIHIDEKTKKITLSFHKQALYSGKIAAVTSDTSSPLGNVDLIIQTREIGKFLEWLVPPTEEGRIIKRSKFKDIFNL